MIHTYSKNPQILTVLISSFIFLVLLTTSTPFSSINKDIQTQYLLLKNTFSSSHVSPNIIIVGIDEESFTHIGHFPFDRKVYAEAIENLESLKPATIAFDILLLDRSTEIQDSYLRDTLKQSSNIVFGASINRDGRVFLPEEEIFGGLTDYGYVSPLVEASNRTTYSFRPQRTLEDYGIIEHFSIRILRQFYSHIFEQDYTDFGYYDEGFFHFSERLSIPLSATQREEILIRFLPSSQFRSISFSDLLQAERLTELSQELDFTDSIVLIGPAAQGLNDEFFTPLGTQYGVFVHANILNTILTRQYLQYFDSRAEWILIFCIILISVTLNFSKRSVVLLYGNLIVLGVFVILIPLFLLLGVNLIINFPFEIVISFFLAFGLTNLLKYLIEDINKERLGKALSEYVSSDVMQEVLDEQGKLYLDGQKRELIVYFSDIENFTHISEVLSPEELVVFLREYLSELTEILMKHGAYIDKYEGDAIMALWGAFGPLESHTADGVCEVLLEQERIVQELSQKWKQKFGQELRVRSGVHTGEAIVGNIGAPGRKMNFTALGDTVNLASRLEGVNKYYHSYICVSETFVNQASEDYIFCELDSIRVLGKDIEVKIYMLLGKEGELTQKLLVQKEQYEHALDLYRKMDFERASELLQELLQEYFHVSETLYQRTQTFLTSPPGPDWDGTWNMDAK